MTRGVGLFRIVPVLLGLFWSALAQADWFSEEIAIMGTNVRVELWSEDRRQADEAIAKVIAEMHRIDHVMSTYKPESEISLINRRAADEIVPVGAELLGLIRKGIEISELSGGAFDITYASAGQLYDFRAGIRPDADEVDEVLSVIGYRYLELDSQRGTLHFAKPGVRIDLGGIAKGYAVERGVNILRQQGILHGLVSAGGDTQILGDRRGAPWIVGIRDPRNESGVVARLPLVDEAISTSGDYERYFEEDGVRYHHIISPATGQSASEVHSVTIIGPNATMTDGLATSVFVLGVEKGLRLINSMGEFEAVIVDNTGRMHQSEGFLLSAK